MDPIAGWSLDPIFFSMVRSGSVTASFSARMSKIKTKCNASGVSDVRFSSGSYSGVESGSDFFSMVRSESLTLIFTGRMSTIKTKCNAQWRERRHIVQRLRQWDRGRGELEPR